MCAVAGLDLMPTTAGLAKYVSLTRSGGGYRCKLRNFWVLFLDCAILPVVGDRYLPEHV